MIWGATVLVFTTYVIIGAPFGVFGTPIDNDRFIHVTSLDGQKHIIDRLSQPVAHEVLPNDITFHLFTRHGDSGTPFNMGDFTGDMDLTGFDPTLPTYFFIHGWTINHSFYTELPRRLLDAELGIPANVFLVDYRRVAKFFYTYAVGSLPAVGMIIAEGITKMVEHYGMGYEQINISGHSLGGQLCGFVGASLNGQAGQIVSLDPAGPLFEGKDPSVRLDPTDARHVQVIHTNGGLLGYRGSLGHADYFPNSGRMAQPNCGSDLVGLCAHGRALMYYYESMHSDQFVATKCDSWELYLGGSCDANETSVMGMIVSDKVAMGNYYLKTAEQSPFALG